MFCFHKWNIEHTNVVPSRELSRLKGQEDMPAEVLFLLRIQIEGVTHIYYKCSKCGLVKQDRVFGAYSPK